MVFVNIHKGKTNLSLEHRRLVALVDPGSTPHSIVKRSFVIGVSNKRLKRNKTSYLVAGGTYSTEFEVKVGISVPEFNTSLCYR
jgi:hypothetical protein